MTRHCASHENCGSTPTKHRGVDHLILFSYLEQGHIALDSHALTGLLSNMAARRSLGGGRVLGSGRSLGPADAAKQQHTRNTSLLSPSESSISLGSQTSSTPVSFENEDIASRVALDQLGPNGAATASSRPVCPICNEEMVSSLSVWQVDVLTIV